MNKAFGKRAVVGCKGNKYISQFQICVAWIGDIIDCPDGIASNCNDKVILTDGTRAEWRKYDKDMKTEI